MHDFFLVYVFCFLNRCKRRKKTFLCISKKRESESHCLKKRRPRITKRSIMQEKSIDKAKRTWFSIRWNFKIPRIFSFTFKAVLELVLCLLRSRKTFEGSWEGGRVFFHENAQNLATNEKIDEKWNASLVSLSMLDLVKDFQSKLPS